MLSSTSAASRPTSSSSDGVPPRPEGTLLDIEPDTTCCTICGAPVGDDREGNMNWYHLPEWWQKPVLLSASPSAAQHEVYEIPVQSCSSNEFVALDPSGSVLRPFEGFEDIEDPPNLYIPVHTTCLNMAKRFIRSNAGQRTIEQPAMGLTSMWRLWQILKSRAYATYVNCKDPENPDLSPEDFWILHPYEYYGAFWCKPEYWVGWDRWRNDSDDSDDSTLTVYPKFFEGDPIKVPRVTGYIVRQLKRLHPAHIFPQDTGSRAFAERLNRLPREILDMILKHLQPFHEVPLVCNRLLKPYLWRRALLTQEIFSWLWNLDRVVKADHGIDRREEELTISEYMDLKWFDNKWDWELLVRQLAQVNVFEPGNVMQDAPYGLRNRRRIWRILEEMRIDDVPHVTQVSFSEEDSSYDDDMSE